MLLRCPSLPESSSSVSASKERKRGGSHSASHAGAEFAWAPPGGHASCPQPPARGHLPRPRLPAARPRGCRARGLGLSAARGRAQAGSDVSPPTGPRSTTGSAPPTSSLPPFPEIHVEAPPSLSNTRTQCACAPSSRVGLLLSPTLPQPPRGPGTSTHAEKLAAPPRVSKCNPGSSVIGKRHRKAFESTPAPPNPATTEDAANDAPAHLAVH